MLVQKPEKPGEHEDISVWRNIGKIIFLIIVLIVAWIVLEWLMG